MRYSKINEVDAVLMYQRQRYKVKLRDVYTYDVSNDVIDCHIHFSSYKTQQSFYNCYMQCNGYDLAKSVDFAKFITLDDVDYIAYIYSVSDSKQLKAHLERIQYKR